MYRLISYINLFLAVKAKISSQAIFREERITYGDYTFRIKNDYYKIDIIQIFKGAGEIFQALIAEKPKSYPKTNSADIYIHTFTEESLCGTKLTHDEIYLLTGTLNANLLHINNCHWKVQWSKMSQKMKNGVAGQYVCG